LKVDLYDLKDKNDGKLKNKQWDINTAMKDRLGNITDSLLPSAIFYLNMSKDEISNQIIDKNTK
jgi:hypothetical protein